jgi:hypothetical protein
MLNKGDQSPRCLTPSPAAPVEKVSAAASKTVLGS